MALRSRSSISHRGAVIVLDKLADFRFVGDVDIIDDHLFDGAVQVGDGLVDDPVHHHHIQQLGGTVHEVRDVYRHHAQPAVGDRAFPESIQSVLILQAGNEGFDLIHGLDGIPVKLDAVLNLHHIKGSAIGN